MEKFKETKKRFLREVKNNNICISENPKGTDISWPKSFASLYYKNLMSKIYHKNKSPLIIQINESKKIIDDLWNSFFKNPVIKNEFLSTNQSLFIFEELYKDYLFDVVIIKEYKNIENINKVINCLKTKLKKNGVIIIENINFDFIFVTKLFFKHYCKIFDFRFNRFLVDNCIIEIKRYSFKKRMFFKIYNLPKYIFYLLVELTYYILYLLSKKYLVKNKRNHI